MESKIQLSNINTVAFNGIDVLEIQVQISISQGMPAFIICGLPDKAINESRDRIRSALAALGLALPARRIVVNMSPANVPKEGSHYDLPITMGLLEAIGVIDKGILEEYIILGELALDSNLIKVPGVLIAAIHAGSVDKKLICPAECGGEAACGGNIEIIAAQNIGEIVSYFKGRHSFNKPVPKQMERENFGDVNEIIGNPSIKRALEIAAAGGHHLIMMGSPGVGKSMCAKRIASILPDLSIREALEVSMIHSIAGLTRNGLVVQRQFREPHHNASVASILGGGRDCKPGEISLAHHGVLFLDEITLWPPSILNGLRESLETGYISISRVNAHVKFPARYQLIAAANPCPCGKAYEPDVQCTKLPHCVQNYINRIPGPILDRFSMSIQVGRVNPWEPHQKSIENSAVVKNRVQQATLFRSTRDQFYTNQAISANANDMFCLADASLDVLNKISAARNLSNRKYYNTQRIARSIADLVQSNEVKTEHILEALTYIG